MREKRELKDVQMRLADLEIQFLMYAYRFSESKQ